MSDSRIDLGNLDEHASNFNRLIPNELQLIIKTLIAHEKQVYIIGGAVRDYFFGFPVKDFDLATNAEPDQIMEIISEVGIRTKSLWSQYGTILAIAGKQAVFDISTFRHEVFSTPGKPPEIIFTDSLDIDLARRDFRLNSIVFDPKNQKIIDKFNGLNDIKQKKIQMIGNANVRLVEDGLRIIRLARFIAQFDLTLDADLVATINAIGKYVKFRNYVALKKEIFKLLELDNPTRGIFLLWETGILSTIFPIFKFLEATNNKLDVRKKLDRFGEITFRSTLIRFFGYLTILSRNKALNENIWESIGNTLKLNIKNKQKLTRIFHSFENFPQYFDPKDLKKWIRATGINTSEDLLSLIFLNAEFENNKILLLQKKKISKEANKIQNGFRGRNLIEQNHLKIS
ncbi:MAG: hypothetical protein ACXAC8_09765 [Candidatus Hodarchaeales archaeon]|jgi:tRNA nucleotidyltransferase/poly(A) polymerase